MVVTSNDGATANATASTSVGSLLSKKIENFKQRKAIILTIHVTHHAGTFFCNKFIKFNKELRVPDFACMSREARGPAQSNWTALRQNYDVYSWEYRTHPTPLLETCDWESDEVVSIFISRDPLDRMLAGDGNDKIYNITSERTPAQWWAWANDKVLTKNYAYEILSGDRSGSAPGSMERAKKLLDRIDFVIDQDCLNENLVELAKLLGLNNTEEQLAGRHKGGTIHHQAARERIGNDTLWEYLLERNMAGIELHAYAKERSFIVCNASVATKKEKLSIDASIFGIPASSLLFGMACVVLFIVIVFMLVWKNRQCFKKKEKVVSSGQGTQGMKSSHDVNDEEVKSLL